MVSHDFFKWLGLCVGYWNSPCFISADINNKKNTQISRCLNIYRYDVVVESSGTSFRVSAKITINKIRCKHNFLNKLRNEKSSENQIFLCIGISKIMSLTSIVTWSMASVFWAKGPLVVLTFFPSVLDTDPISTTTTNISATINTIANTNVKLKYIFSSYWYLSFF